MKTIRRLFFLTGLITVFFQCAPDRLGMSVGGGSGTETVGGRAFDRDQKPAAGIDVSIRRSDFLDTGSFYKTQDVFSADTTTDAEGKFLLLVGITGEYTIAMYDKKGNAAFERCTVKLEDSIYVNTTLRRTGELTGRINQAHEAELTRFTVHFYGFSRHSILTDDSGSFSISGLPAGEYRFKVIPQTPIYKPYEGNVTVISDETTQLPSINMQKADFRFHPSDSMVVRAILDSNGLQALPIDTLAKAEASWPYRIIELSSGKIARNNMYFRMLTSKIGDLAELRKIDISNNIMMKRLPNEIGKLIHLSELSLRNASISVIPPEIKGLVSLKKLDLSENTKSSGRLVIPAEIGDLDSLEILIVKNNTLFELPPEIGKCRALKVLDAAICKLKTLPGELSNCRNLEFINAEYNYIDSLPAAITELGSTFEHQFINLNYNRFCLLYEGQIPQKAFDWLDIFSTSSAWRTTQDCQGICIPPTQN